MQSTVTNTANNWPTDGTDTDDYFTNLNDIFGVTSLISG